MSTNSYPSLEEFLAAPIEEIAKVAPSTLVFSAGGTRRNAALAGISPISDDYAHQSMKKVLTCFDMIFQHGIRHICAVIITPNNLKEITPGFREKLVKWVDSILLKELFDYGHLRWRVRLIGTESLPELKVTAKRLQKATPQPNGPTIWFHVVPQNNSPWKELLAAVHRTQAQTLKEAIQALYGEDIPPATLFLSFGKPQLTFALIPPLLMGDLQCYWMQRPSINLDKSTLRTILYDYAYLRNTWCADKTGRAEKALKYRSAWQQGPTIGLGMRLGPFWYPAPISLPSDH